MSRRNAFAEVLPRFLGWIGDGSYRLATWGTYNVKLVQVECKRQSIKCPKRFTTKHTDVKSEFAARMRIRKCGMGQALEMLRMPLDGTHHRGIDNARNIAKILRHLAR